MKFRILILLLISSTVIFTNCNSDDESAQTETINGAWNLKNVNGGLQGLNIDYPLGDVIWDFNIETNILRVENNIMTTGPEQIYSGLVSGNYIFEIIQNGETQTLFINNTERGVLILLNDNLKIDNGLAVDGFITEFER